MVWLLNFLRNSLCLRFDLFIGNALPAQISFHAVKRCSLKLFVLKAANHWKITGNLYESYQEWCHRLALKHMREGSLISAVFSDHHSYQIQRSCINCVLYVYGLPEALALLSEDELFLF